MNELDRVFTLDFETTGVDAKTCKPVEVALLGLNTEFVTLIDPEEPIPPETSAVHHITDDDVKGAPNWHPVKTKMVSILEVPTGQKLHILVAHNAQYEKDVLGDFIPVLWLCTYKAALRVWPDAPSHKNEALRYWLKLGDNRGRSAKQNPHSALHDTQVTFLLLCELLKHATLEQMIEWTEVPAKLPKMPMGKHFGQTWDTVPGPYLSWCLQQKDMREDVKFCAQTELTRRRVQNATRGPSQAN
jgi:exodeoxyribonuclease X